MRWYFPSYTGDFRLVEVDNSSYREQADKTSCVLEIVDPTPHELPVLDAFLAEARKNGWTPITKIATAEVDGKQRQEILLATTVAVAGRALYAFVRPADRTITAVRSSGGKIEVFETSDLQKVEDALTPDAVIPPKPEAEPEAKPKKEKKAVSVKRATPSCPQCVPGAVSRASEVLHAFLTPDERRTWDKEHFITVQGGLSGNRYVLAHRHSAIAAQIGRICFDLDDDLVVHFHDNSVPPEEEVLSAKLILEHREPWLRNEATLFHALGRPEIVRYKNPFGDVMDGVAEAGQTQGIGLALKALLG
jgi:hypothetical protein